jgi:hypothetical protein
VNEAYSYFLFEIVLGGEALFGLYLQREELEDEPSLL